MRRAGVRPVLGGALLALAAAMVWLSIRTFRTYQNRCSRTVSRPAPRRGAGPPYAAHHGTDRLTARTTRTKPPGPCGPPDRTGHEVVPATRWTGGRTSVRRRVGGVVGNADLGVVLCWTGTGRRSRPTRCRVRAGAGVGSVIARVPGCGTTRTCWR